jgi:hypothetical protein
MGLDYESIKNDNVSMLCVAVILVCVLLLVKKAYESRSVSGLAAGVISRNPNSGVRGRGMQKKSDGAGGDVANFLGSPEPPVFYDAGDMAAIAANQQAASRSQEGLLSDRKPISGATLLGTVF